MNSRLDELQAAMLALEAAPARRRQCAPPSDRRAPMTMGLRTAACDCRRAVGAPPMSSTNMSCARAARRWLHEACGCAASARHPLSGAGASPAGLSRARGRRPGGLKETERAAREVLSLPMFPRARRGRRRPRDRSAARGQFRRRSPAAPGVRPDRSSSRRARSIEACDWR